MQTPFKIDFDEAFPLGAGTVSNVTPANDFDASTRERPVQARDDLGRLLWMVEVMDFDPDAKDRTHKVKIAADQQPLLPAQVDGQFVRPVVLENLAMTPWINDNGMRPKIAYSFRCTGLSEPKARNSASSVKVV